MATAATKKPKRASKPKSLGYEPLPIGTVLLDVAIEERAVPWKAPTVGKGRGFKDPRLLDWQDTVRLYADLNRAVREPYAGPVAVQVVARFAKGPLPDACNVLKAIEDALQGSVFLNDRQVIRNGCERTQSDRDVVRIIVWATAELLAARDEAAAESIAGE